MSTQITSATKGVELTKYYDETGHTMPSVVYEFSSNRPDQVSVRVVESLPDEIDPEQVGFRKKEAGENWTIRGTELVLEVELDDAEDHETLMALRPDASYDPDDLVAEPKRFDVRQHDTNTTQQHRSARDPVEEVTAEMRTSDASEGSISTVDDAAAGIDLNVHDSPLVSSGLDASPDEVDEPADDRRKEESPEDDESVDDERKEKPSGGGEPEDEEKKEESPEDDEPADDGRKEELSGDDERGEEETKVKPPGVGERGDDEGKIPWGSVSDGSSNDWEDAEAPERKDGAADPSGSRDSRGSTTGDAETVGKSTGDESLVDRLAAELEDGAGSSESRQYLEEALGNSSSGSTDARIRQIQADLSDVRAYRSALEEFIDENGSAQEVIDEFESRLEAAETAVSTLESKVTEGAQSIENVQRRTDQLQSRIDSTSSNLDTIVDDLEDVRDEIHSLEGRVPEYDVDDRLSSIEGEVNEVSELLDDLKMVLCNEEF